MSNNSSLHAVPQRLREVLFHEAGHAVAALALGYEVSCVGVYRGDHLPRRRDRRAEVILDTIMGHIYDYAEGACKYPWRTEDFDEPYLVAEDKIAITLAGPAAERLVNSVARCEGFDFKQVWDLAEVYGIDDHRLVALRRRAARIVRRFRPAVEALASRILKHTFLLGYEVEEVVLPLLKHRPLAS